MKITTTLVKLVEFIKKVLGIHTYQVEFGFVAIVLMGVVVFVGERSPVEWIGGAAVFLTFTHAKVANRLAEREAYRQRIGSDLSILSYHYKIGRYFVAKEILWFAYFILLGAWSALAGVILFLLYEPWRKLWRKYHSLEDKLRKQAVPRMADKGLQK